MGRLGLLAGLILISAISRADLRKTNALLSHEINMGFRNEKWRTRLVQDALTAQAVNHIKSKRTQFFSYAMGDYFCFRYLTSQTCWRQVQPLQIQFLGQSQILRVQLKEKSANLLDAVELTPVPAKSAWWRPLPTAHAQDADLSEILAEQYQSIAADQEQLEEDCVEAARRRHSTDKALKCGSQYNEDLRRLSTASKKAIDDEYERLRNSMMIVTQNGWRHINEAADQALHSFSFNANLGKQYACGTPIRYGKFQVSATAESRVLKLTSDSGRTYTATYASTDHTSLNRCDLQARDRRFLETCDKPEAIEVRRGMVWDSCRLLEVSCEPKRYRQVLLVGQCETPDCQSLTRVKDTDLRQDLYALQNTMLVAEALNRCCKNPKCPPALETELGIRIKPHPGTTEPQVARPDGNDPKSNSQLPQAER